MAAELTVLALAGLLQAIQICLMAVPANLELGTAKTLSPRDPDRMGKPLEAQVSRRTGRLFRAMNNHFEGLILFTLAVVVVVLSGRSTGLTVACAWIYLGARILYIPAYVLGLAPWRSLISAAGFLATVLMILVTIVMPGG